MDIKEAFKKGDPVTGRPCAIAKDLFDSIQATKNLSVGETLDLIIKEAAEAMGKRNDIDPKALEPLHFWRALDQVGEQFKSKEG